MALIERAERDNPGLHAAGLRVLQARAQLGVLRGRLWPQQQRLTAAATWTDGSKNAPNSALIDTEFGTASLGLDLAWEIDLWGRFRRGIEAGAAALEAAEAGFGDALLALRAEVATTYVTLRVLDERLQIAERNAAIQSDSLAIARARHASGVTTELDVFQARALLETTRARLPALRRDRRLARNALAVLLGEAPQNAVSLAAQGQLPTAPANIAVGAPADLIRRRPDVRRAEALAAAQSARIGIAKADLYPAFSLGGTIRLAAGAATGTTATGASGFDELFDGDSLSISGGPGVSWNLFNYGRIKNRVRVEDARFEQALAAHRAVVLEALREAEDALASFARSDEEARTLAASVEAARGAVRIANLQYRDGAVDYQRVLDSQSTLTQQEDRHTAARGAVILAAVQLYRALGGGWEHRDAALAVPGEVLTRMRTRADWPELP